MTGQDDRVPFRLSGGEKRRAAIAGVLAMHPDVLLLDEPSMFLDPRGRRELIRLINALPGTRLIASHDLALVRDDVQPNHPDGLRPSSRRRSRRTYCTTGS